MIELASSSFWSTIRSAPATLVQFWAAWDEAYDERLRAILRELEPTYSGRILFARLDVEQAAGIAAELRIVNLPALGYFRSSGFEIEIGLRDKEGVRHKLD